MIFEKGFTTTWCGGIKQSVCNGDEMQIAMHIHPQGRKYWDGRRRIEGSSRQEEMFDETKMREN